MKLIEKLYSGPIDVVGDVHGEIDALRDLLHFLGYESDGSNRDGRRLTFVGDLVDRGPDSPAVVESVIELVQTGRAQCVLGNHELNLLLGDKKEGNHWFIDPSDEEPYPSQPVNPGQKLRFLDFFRTLPLVLEREDLRIVHACWNVEAIDILRDPSDLVADVSKLHDQFKKRIDSVMKESGVFSKYREEQRVHGQHLFNPSWEAPVFLPAHAEMAEKRQTNNPVKVITSGEERCTHTPFWAGGRWRMVQRQKWWDRYEDDVPVIVGHYWRGFNEALDCFSDKFGPDLFEGIKSYELMGKQQNVYCVDFSVGKRHRERAISGSPLEGRLSAVRTPEWEVWHDDGSSEEILIPG